MINTLTCANRFKRRRRLFERRKMKHFKISKNNQEQFSGIQQIDGNLTLDENLADIGGNRLAYFAYSKFIIEIFISLINHF